MSRRAGLLVAALLVGAMSSCAERQVERDIYDPRIRCALIITHIETGGERFRLHDSITGKSYGTMCTCTTHEELFDPDFRLMINEMSYDACVEFVEREGYAVEDSTCLEDYEAEYWAVAFGHAEGDPNGEPEFCDSMSVGGCGVE